MKFSLQIIKQLSKKVAQFLLVCFVFFSGALQAQFQLNGDATSMGGNCYELTADVTSQAGSIWNVNTYDLTQPFDIQFNIFLGCKTYSVGADGMVFVFQPLSINAGSSGGGMGFGGIVPSLGIEFDTYQNGWDPAFCHVAIEKNGDYDHTIAADLLAGPVQLSPTAAAIPDCASHPGRIVWNPTTHKLDVYFDCSLRVSYTGDIVNTIFGGNPNVYWGFTAATGGASNTQQVCYVSSPVNDLRDTSICIGASVPLSVVGGTTYAWSPATGLSSTSIANPVATPSVTTTYTVIITDGCGFQRKDSSRIVVFDPFVGVTNAAICQGSSATLTASGANTYAWAPAMGLSATSGASVTANPTSSQTYTITGTDTHGCSNTAQSTVVVLPPLTLSTSHTDVICNGAANGTATVNASGGVPPYTYSWNSSPVQTTATATGLGPGTYTVSVLDSPPCTPSGVELVPNGDFSSGNTGFSSSYAYTVPPNTAEGQYWVATGAQTPTWNGGMGSAGDHTTGTGNFMLVNGAGAPNSNVWCETINVSANTNYLFSTWVSSLNASSPALLQFSANGIPLGAVFSAPAVPNSWSQFFASWNSGISTSVSICIVNQNTSLGGNDFGLDDISFEECITPPVCPTTTTVTIAEPLPLTVTTTQVNELCKGGNNGSATATPAGGTAPYTYSWNSTPVQTTATASNLTAGNYTVTITDFNLCVTTTTVNVTEPTVIVPTVSATPAAICVGQSSIITTSASGGVGGYGYTWVNAPIPAQASQSVSPVITTTYTVTITDANGCSVVDSTTLTVNPLPTPTAGSNTPVCENQTVNLTSDVVSSNSWVGPNGFVSLLQNPSIPSVTLAAAGVYTLTVTDGNNCQATVTTTVVINPEPVLTPVTNQVICANASTAAITFVSNPVGATVNWTNSDASIGVGAAGAGDINAFVTTNATNAATVGNFVATPVLTGCTGASINFSITVNPIPILSAVTNDTVCAGAMTTAISFVTNPLGASVGWTNSDPSIGVAAFGLGDIASFTGTNITNAIVTGNFIAAPSLNSCVGAPQNFSISVKPLPILNAVTDQIICETTSSTAITFVSNPIGATVSWTNSTPSIGLAASGTGDIAAFTGTNGTATPTTGNVVATPVFNGCTGPAINFNLTVSPAPTLAIVPSQTICATTSTAAINFNATPNIATINWTNSIPTIGIAATGSGNINSFTALNSSGASVIANLVATPVIGTCTGPSQNFSITVDPMPVLTSVTSQTVCETSNVSAINFVSNPVGATVHWTNSAPSIGLAAIDSVNIAQFTALNGTVNPIIASIIALPTLGNCTGTPINFSITVNPLPSISAVTSQTLCAGLSTTAINFTPTPITATVNWTNSAQGIGIGAAGSGDINSFATTNTTGAPLIGNFIATPTLSGCTGTPQNFSITVNPGVVVNPISNITACNNSTVAASSFASTPAGATFDWTNTNTAIGLAASGTGDYTSFTATNTSVLASTATVAVTPTLNNCNGPVVNYTITVNPTPATPIVTGVSYCQNATANSLTATPSTGLSWYTTPALTNPSSVAPVPSTAIAGTSTYYVTQTVLNCVSLPASLPVLINPLPVASINPPASSGCSPVCVNFTNAPSTSTSCLWDLGDGNVSSNCTPSECYTTAGTYTSKLTVVDANHCVNSSTALIVVYPNPVADFNAGPQPTTILDPEVYFSDASTGATITSWNWTFGDGTGSATIKDPSYTYQDTGTYAVQLNVVSDFGCVNSIVKNIVIDEEYLVYVPNAFTPNHDRNNEVFLPKGTGIKTYHLYVFDRWGNKVFESDDLNKGWDGTFGGTAAQEDVYAWKIKLKDNFGNNKQLSGTVTLIR